MERIETIFPKLVEAVKTHHRNPTKENTEKARALTKLIADDIQTLGPSFKTLESLSPVYDKIVAKYTTSFNALRDIKKLLGLDDENIEYFDPYFAIKRYDKDFISSHMGSVFFIIEPDEL